MELKILHWFEELHNPVLDFLMYQITCLGNGGLIWLVIAAAMFLYSGYRVATYLLEGRKSQDVTAELIQQAVRTPQPQETKGQPVHTLRPTPDAAEYVPDADDETADEQETTHTAPDELLSVDFDTLQSVNPDIPFDGMSV